MPTQADVSTPRHAGDATASYRPLEDAIEEERMRLARAEAVLGCVYLALLQVEEDQRTDGPEFALVVDVAQQLVREAINRLDSLYIGPLIRDASLAENSAPSAGDSDAGSDASSG